MGSHHSWKLTVENKTPSLEEAIKTFLKRETTTFNEIWFKWCAESKWWALDYAVEISKHVRGIVFRLDCQGDSNFTTFILDGEFLDERNIWEIPRFPSRPLFKKKLAELKVDREKRALAEEQTKLKLEKERLEKEINALVQKQIALNAKML